VLETAYIVFADRKVFALVYYNTEGGFTSTPKEAEYIATHGLDYKMNGGILQHGKNFLMGEVYVFCDITLCGLEIQSF
jgi:hypothetical protein